MENRLPGWTPDGVVWYTHEGGEQVLYTPETYTTNELDSKDVVYEQQNLCSCGHPDILHIKVCPIESCQCGK